MDTGDPTAVIGFGERSGIAYALQASGGAGWELSRLGRHVR
jgi:hypothetical protein